MKFFMALHSGYYANYGILDEQLYRVEGILCTQPICSINDQKGQRDINKSNMYDPEEWCLTF